jgi:hypothetical protein
MSPTDQRVMSAALKNHGIDLDNEEGIDLFNRALRTNPQYQAFLQTNFGNPGATVRAGLQAHQHPARTTMRRMRDASRYN